MRTLATKNNNARKSLYNDDLELHILLILENIVLIGISPYIAHFAAKSLEI